MNDSFRHSARRAFEAGQSAREKQQPLVQATGWAYPQGKYYWWFVQGWKGRDWDATEAEFTGNQPGNNTGSMKRYDEMRKAGIRPSDIEDAYAEAKARKLIAEAFREAGSEANAKQYETGGFTTAPLRALTRYISSRE